MELRMMELRTIMARTNKSMSVVAMAGVLAGLALAGAPAFAQTKAPVAPTTQGDAMMNDGMGESPAKELLLLMDKNHDGKISEEECMNFMKTEFTRLDTNHDGELDASELAQARIRGTQQKHPGGR